MANGPVEKLVAAAEKELETLETEIEATRRLLNQKRDRRKALKDFLVGAAILAENEPG